MSQGTEIGKGRNSLDESSTLASHLPKTEPEEFVYLDVRSEDVRAFTLTGVGPQREKGTGIGNPLHIR